MRSYWWAILGGGAVAYLVTRHRRKVRATEEQAQWLARVVIMEHASVGPGDEWTAIMQTVINRIVSIAYPNTVRGVVTDVSWPGGGPRGEAYIEAIGSSGGMGYRSPYGHIAPPDSSMWPMALEHARRFLSGEFENLIGSRTHQCHPGARCDYEGALDESGKRKCVGGRLIPRWALPLNDPHSQAEQEPVVVGTAIFS